jgi:hypothetical protein
MVCILDILPTPILCRRLCVRLARLRVGREIGGPLERANGQVVHKVGGKGSVWGGCQGSQHVG